MSRASGSGEAEVSDVAKRAPVWRSQGWRFAAGCAADEAVDRVLESAVPPAADQRAQHSDRQAGEQHGVCRAADDKRVPARCALADSLKAEGGAGVWPWHLILRALSRLYTGWQGAGES